MIYFGKCFQFAFIFILVSIFIAIKAISNDFLKIKALSSGEYFVIFENNINIYNSKFSNCSTIFFFNNSKINPTLNDLNNITISEYNKNGEILYILCLIKEYLLIYDYNNKNITNHLLPELSLYSKDDNNELHYYNFIPYDSQYDNNIHFLIIFIYAHRINLLYYYIERLQKIYNNKKVELIIFNNDLSPPEIRCHKLSSNDFQCFYSRDWQKKLRNIKFDLTNPLNSNIKSIKDNSKSYISIKSAISYNNQKTLVCTIDVNNTSLCFANKDSYDFEEVPSSNFDKCFELDIQFYNETNQFVLICKENNLFTLLIYDYYSYSNSFSLIESRKINIKDCNCSNAFSLIYNNSINYYNLITNCNFTNRTCCSHSQEREEIIETTLPQNIEEYTTDIPSSNYYSDAISSLPSFSSEKIEIEFTEEINKNLTASINSGEIIKWYIDINKEEIQDNLKDILDVVDVGNNYQIRGNDFSLKIKPTNSTIFDNSTHVEFNECEKILRNHYNISNSSIITFFQFEFDNDDSQSYIKQVEYQTYNDEMVILDLSLCKDVNIKIYHEIKEGVILDESFISLFENLGIDIFDIKDSFFNDLCNSYSDNGNDIILQDRIKYIYQNFSLCNQECKYNNIDIENMTITCDCMVKENLSTITTPLNLEEAKESSISDSNIGVVRCYNLVFSFKDKSKNIGFWIFSILLVINIVFLVIFFMKGMKSIAEFIFNEMVKYGYLSKNDRMFFEGEKNKDNKENEIQNDYKKKNNVSNLIKKGKDNGNIINIKRTNKKENSKILKNETDLNKSSNRYLNSANKIKLNNEDILDDLTKSRNKKINSKKSKDKNKKNKKIHNLTTDNQNQKSDEGKGNNFSIIKIKLNNIENYKPQDSFQTLHNYTFEEAIEYDKRSIFKIFYIYLLSKQIIFHTFFQKNPLELFSLRICLFIFMISTDLALNSLLYLNDNISKKYQYAKGLFLFTFSNNLTIILLSTLLSFFLIALVSKLGNSTNAIRNVFRNEEEKIQNKKYKINDKRKKEIFLEIEKILKCLKIKIFILIAMQIILILFFWYFVTAFCHVYANTQTSWLLDALLSFLSRLIIEFLFALLFAKLYIVAVESNVYCIYRALLFIYDFS